MKFAVLSSECSLNLTYKKLTLSFKIWTKSKIRFQFFSLKNFEDCTSFCRKSNEKVFSWSERRQFIPDSWEKRNSFSVPNKKNEVLLIQEKEKRPCSPFPQRTVQSSSPTEIKGAIFFSFLKSRNEGKICNSFFKTEKWFLFLSERNVITLIQERKGTIFLFFQERNNVLLIQERVKFFFFYFRKETFSFPLMKGMKFSFKKRTSFFFLDEEYEVLLIQEKDRFPFL